VWQRRQLWHRPRLTRNIVYLFLISFVLFALRGRASFAHDTFDSSPTIKISDQIAFAAALILAIVQSTRKDSGGDSK
jgi:hypothetical protein